MTCLLMLFLIKSFVSDPMWWERAMFRRKSQDPDFMNSLSKLLESAPIEAKNACMFKVEEVVLVYPEARCKSLGKWIIWRSHRTVGFSWITNDGGWLTDDASRFRWCSADYDISGSWIDSTGFKLRQYGQSVWPCIYSSTCTSDDWLKRSHTSTT